MQEAVPEAFTSSETKPVQGVFIDGQIQLMKPDFIKTMDMFYKIQFANPINRYLKQHPHVIVVLAFDDYNNVPPSKSMTQLKRKQRVTDVLPFTDEVHVHASICFLHVVMS